jgi:hypothetical protein
MGALVFAIPAVLTVTLTSESDPDAVEGTDVRESDEKTRVEVKD